VKTITRPAVASLCILFASTAYGFGGGSCIPVTGVVQSVPDPTCAIKTDPKYSWPGTVEAADPLLVNFGVPAEQACLTIRGFGTAQFSGVSGLTTVGVGNPQAGNSATPLGFAPATVRSGLTVFTSQAVLNGQVYAGRKLLKGTLYTKDTGVIELAPTSGKVGQILKIVGGGGDFAGASGTITVAGQELGGFAFYSGEVCGAK